MGDPGLIFDEKPTVNDIARVAGVSLATVDRVLNDRPGVRSVTIERVNKAIAELGYVRDAAAASLARRRFRTLLFILPETSNEVVSALEQQVAEQGAKLLHERMRLKTQRVTPFDPNAIVQAL
ncbi:MAG: LacI family DNA-binding transcriptional regulator, partial [Paracoccaceae bacterium]